MRWSLLHASSNPCPSWENRTMVVVADQGAPTVFYCTLSTSKYYQIRAITLFGSSQYFITEIHLIPYLKTIKSQNHVIITIKFFALAVVNIGRKTLQLTMIIIVDTALTKAPSSLSTGDLDFSPGDLCRCQAPRSTTSSPSQDTAQVDMVQGLHLWNALILAKGAHLADAANQGLHHTSPTENPGEVHDTVREVTVQQLPLIMSLAQSTGLAPLLNHPQ